MMQYLGNWQFWVAVVVVGIGVHLIMSYVLPKLTGGGS
jgi:nicotinamide riboside transporter PnuC